MSFTIDRLTNSIEEKSTGNSFATDVVEVTKAEIKTVLKKNGWRFNWKVEFNSTNGKIYKLVIKGQEKIQGLICLESMVNYVEIHLLETAPHNFGEKKEYFGVIGNLVAFACKLSIEQGFDGYVAFTAKSSLIQHYKQHLGAVLIFNSRMMIAPEASKKLVDLYYKNHFNG